MKKPPQNIKKRRGSGNTTTIFDLTDDLLIEILVRLPIKSACQCKSISKHWRALTSSPSFVCGFRRAIDGGRTSSSPFTPLLPLPFTVVPECPGWIFEWVGSLVVEHKAEFRIPSSSANTMFGSRGFSLSFLPCYLEDIPGFRVVGSSNGLLLCCAEKYDPLDLVYYVCNPFMEVWFQLPPPPPAQEIDVCYVHEDCLLGFMCDPYYNDRYRVVRVQSVSTFPGMSLQIDVFSSETGEWRQLILSCPLYLQLTPNYCNGVVCNGRLHWISGRHGLFAFDPIKETINSNDRLSFIDLPPDLKGLDSIYLINVHLGVCRGRLRILYTFTPPGEDDDNDVNQNYGEFVLPHMPMLKVWELEDYSAGKWCILHDKRIDISSDTSWRLRREWKSPFSMSVAFHPYDEDIVYIWFPSKFVSCNLRHSRFKVIDSNKHLQNHGSMKLLLAQPWCHTPVQCPPQAKSTLQDNLESGPTTLKRNRVKFFPTKKTK